MTRYGEGEEWYPNQGDMWWANVERALRGQRGQAAILDLYHALHALPERKLVHGHLAADGQVCAVGALALYRRTRKGEQAAVVLAELEGIAPPYCTCGHVNTDHTARGCMGCAEQNMRVAWYRGKRMDDGEDPAHYLSYLPKQPLHAYEFDDGYSEGDSDSTARVGVAVGTTYMLAWYMGYLNDEEYMQLTPEARWQAMVDWCVANLAPVPV